MAKMPAHTMVRCFCGAITTGPKEKRDHMLHEHGLNLGYQNVGNIHPKKPNGWMKRGTFRKNKETP